jgi:hypothetical protein
MSDRKEQIINIISSIINACLNLVGCYLVEWLVIPDLDKDILPPTRFLQYFLLYNSIRQFSRVFKYWSYYSILYKMVEFPRMVWPIVIKPYTKMFLGLMMFVCLFGGIYILVREFPKMIGIQLTYSTKAYIFICSSTLLLRSFGNILISLIVRWGYKQENKREHINLTLGLINEERIRYLIYLLFFIALLILPFYTFQGQKFSYNRNLPGAILSSFATYIAFDRLFNNWSLIKFSPRKHWQLLLEVYKKDPKYTDLDNYLVKKDKDMLNKIND